VGGHVTDAGIPLKEQLPWRAAPDFASVLGVRGGIFDVFPGGAGEHIAMVRGVLERPLDARLSINISVHSRAGIPFARGSTVISPGDRSFEAGLALLAMEGYAHLKATKRQAIADRVWTRRAYALLSAR
jgi:hypothetical protein